MKWTEQKVTCIKHYSGVGSRTLQSSYRWRAIMLAFTPSILLFSKKALQERQMRHVYCGTVWWWTMQVNICRPSTLCQNNDVSILPWSMVPHLERCHPGKREWENESWHNPKSEMSSWGRITTRTEDSLAARETWLTELANPDEHHWQHSPHWSSIVVITCWEYCSPRKQGGIGWAKRILCLHGAWMRSFAFLSGLDVFICVYIAVCS